jgi:hypothetical protein
MSLPPTKKELEGKWLCKNGSFRIHLDSYFGWENIENGLQGICNINDLIAAIAKNKCWRNERTKAKRTKR